MTTDEEVMGHSIKTAEGIPRPSIIACVPSPVRSTALDTGRLTPEADKSNSISNRPVRVLLPIAKRTPIGPIGCEALSRCDAAEPSISTSDNGKYEQSGVAAENTRRHEPPSQSTPSGFVQVSKGTPSTPTTVTSSPSSPTTTASSSLSGTPTTITSSSLGCTPTTVTSSSLGCTPTTVTSSSIGCTPTTVTSSSHGSTPTTINSNSLNYNDTANSCNHVKDNVPVPASDGRFTFEETLLIFDWDDTLLPSSWVQRQGLRLDDSSELTIWQRELLDQVANTVAQTLQIAKQHGTVVLVTNAEEGWIELSCQKFMPTLCSTLLDIKIFSARSTYESLELVSPFDWKLRAFESELQRIYGPDMAVNTNMRKNVLSLGDSLHEREALLKATGCLPNCRPKSLKFVERPDPSQICKQHSLIISCFDHIVHYDGHLDFCIKCP